MLTAVSPTAVARQLHQVQAALFELHRSAHLVRCFPGRFAAAEVHALRQQLERGAFETWRCEMLLASTNAANDEPAPPAVA